MPDLVFEAFFPATARGSWPDEMSVWLTDMAWAGMDLSVEWFEILQSYMVTAHGR